MREKVLYSAVHGIGVFCSVWEFTLQHTHGPECDKSTAPPASASSSAHNTPRAGPIPGTWPSKGVIETHFLGSPSLFQRLDHRDSFSLHREVWRASDSPTCQTHPDAGSQFRVSWDAQLCAPLPAEFS